PPRAASRRIEPAMMPFPFGRPGTSVVATIMESTASRVNEAIDEAVREGADAAEIRLDAAPGLDPEGIGSGAARIPLIAACRAVRDGGRFSGTEEERADLLDRAARTGRLLLD